MISKNSKHGPKVVISGIPQWWINSHLKTNTKSTILFHNWKQGISLPHCIIIRIHINKQTKRIHHQIRLSTVSHFVYQNLWKALMTRILINVWANDHIKNWTMKSWIYLENMKASICHCGTDFMILCLCYCQLCKENKQKGTCLTLLWTVSLLYLIL